MGRVNLRALAIVVMLSVFSGVCPTADLRAGEARSFVESVVGEVIIALDGKRSNEEELEPVLREIFLRAFDVDLLTRAVLGRHWEKITLQQRQAFMRIFPKYISRLYANKFILYAGQSYSIVEEDQLPRRSTRILVSIERTTKAAYLVTLFVRERHGDLKIVGAIVDGVDLVSVQRSEFSSVISRHGMDVLLSRLQRVTD